MIYRGPAVRARDKMQGVKRGKGHGAGRGPTDTAGRQGKSLGAQRESTERCGAQREIGKTVTYRVQTPRSRDYRAGSRVVSVTAYVDLGEHDLPS